ncbi:MAG TPA: AMP-binding protein [Gemmatimonadaceae bacterium]|nr:AMP-binding protein [Gemmatimonadaceae bacterium]
MAPQKLRVMDVLDGTVRKHGPRPALRVKRNSSWHAITWGEYHRHVRQVARALMTLGVQRGQNTVIVGHNSPEWFFADIGSIYAGAIPAGIYTTSSPEQCQYIAAHCEARVAFVDDAEQLAKFLQIRDQLPALAAIVLMHGTPTAPRVYSWTKFLELGLNTAEQDLDRRMASQKADEVATLIYTSGTTGSPKAVMLSHDNLTWTAQAAVGLIGGGPSDQVLSYLPLSHIAEQIVSLHGPIAFGACVAFAESMEKLGDNLRDIRPTMFLGVPRVWEKIQERIAAAGAQNPPMKKKIAAWARRQGLAGGYAEQQRVARSPMYAIANALVFKKVRKQLGLDRARVLVTSAAPISRDTLEFFLSLGLPICEVYGMSECTGPATASIPNRYHTGKAGFCLPGAELKIAADGEVCMRGRHVFKGYYKDAAATADALDADGWLHSGDIGTIDAEGFLQITDRKKDLIITAGGENIAPALVEGYLKGIPVVSQAVVIGDRQRYLSVLLTLNKERIPVDAQHCGSAASDPESAARDERFLGFLQRQIELVNQRLARVQAVKKFKVIPHEFTVEGGELTPTMKVRRKVVTEKYKSEIDQLYS